MSEQKRIDQEMAEYLRQDIATNKRLVAAYKVQTRRVWAVLFALGMAVLAIVGVGVWSIHTITQANSRMLEQAVIMQSVSKAMKYSRSQNDSAQVEILLPNGLTPFQEAQNVNAGLSNP